MWTISDRTTARRWGTPDTWATGYLIVLVVLSVLWGVLAWTL